MCGHSFTREEGAACRTGCPVAGGCGMVTCPNCGHEHAPESKLVSLVKRLVRREPPRPAGEPASGPVVRRDPRTPEASR
jgi:hypothetical protein